MRIPKMGIQDEFGQSGKGGQMLKLYGMDADSIAATVLKG